MKKKFNFYPWLQSEDYGEYCKSQLVEIYDKYFEETDEKQKQELFKDLEVYLTVVCDVIAYRYLVKHHINLFYKLRITVEEYMDYKVKRLLTTIKDKKDEKIKDILGYIYISFMLSSPRLIYDYAEKIGRCKLIKENLPYYQVARNKFFGITKENNTEHYIYNVDTIYLDENNSDTSTIRSNIEKYSYRKWKDNVKVEEESTDYNLLINYVIKIDWCSNNAKNYLLNILKNWNIVETDYQDIKLKQGFGQSYSLIDYIRYKYSKQETNLSQKDFTDVLKILNNLLKGEEK